MSQDSFFVPDGRRYVATAHTRGPWSADHQHAGPPSALLARAIERLVTPEGMALMRMSVELLAPLPIAPLEIATSVLRAGRKVQRVDATLASDGRLVCRATGLAIRVAEVGLPPLPGASLDLPPPDHCAAFAFPFHPGKPGYHTAMEARVARGEWGRGAVAMWLRPRVPLVPGETLSPFQRVMVAADSGNGIAIVLDPRRYTFINADLSVFLHRLPAGEWVCLDAATTPAPTGSGLSVSRLLDAGGPIGLGLQSLVIEKREERR